MAGHGRKFEKYKKCIEAIKLGRSPKEIQEEDPDQSFLELMTEFTSKKKGDLLGWW